MPAALGQHKNDKINRMIQLTDVFDELLRKMGLEISDYNNRLILLSVIQLSGEHCISEKQFLFKISFFRFVETQAQFRTSVESAKHYGPFEERQLVANFDRI